MTAVPKMMKAARMHEVGGRLKIEDVPVPALGSMDVLVRVRSCGIVPNLANILAIWPTWFPHMPQPPLPAIFGLDPSDTRSWPLHKTHTFFHADQRGSATASGAFDPALPV